MRSLEFEKDLAQCLKVLHEGGTILYPTDTIWGIGCDATNPAAVKKIYDIKQRPESKSMIVLMADPRDINRYISRPDPQVFDYLQRVERPTTIIYEGAVGLATNLVGVDGSIGIRVVSEVFCRHLIRRFRKPVVSTSANISGAASPSHFGEIAAEVRTAVDYVVEYRQGDRHPAAASMVVRFNSRGEMQVLRK
jgi:L-threonylcarbamoyladenylate synthase